MARAPGFPTRRAPGHGTEQPRGSRQCCCLLLKSHGKIGGPVADSVGQAEPGVPVTSYSEEPGAAAGRSHARPPRSHNLTLRATTRPLPPPPRRSHVVQAGNGDSAHCGLGAIDRDADPHPARRVRPHSCPRHARAMSRASAKAGGPSETQSPYHECVQAPRIPLVTPERGDLEPTGKKDSSRGWCGTGTMLDEQVDPNNAPASSQASLTSSGERHLSRGQRHAGGGGEGGRYPATLQDPRDTTARSRGSRAQNRALTSGQRPRRPKRAHGPDRGEAHSGHTGMTGGCPRLGQRHTPTDFRS